MFAGRLSVDNDETKKYLKKMLELLVGVGKERLHEPE